MLTELPEDIDLDAVAQEWIAIGLATGRGDRAACEAAFAEAYKNAGLEPVAVEWYDDPIQGAKRQFELTKGDDPSASPMGQPCYGQHAASWLAPASVYRPLIDGLEDVDPFFVIAKNCGWWWPLDGAVIATERMSALHLDGEGDPHCEDGPAMVWPSGLAVYFWHGTEVPKEWIESTPTASEVLSHENAEVRRAGCEILEWDVIEQLDDVEVVDKDAPHIGTLYRATLPEAEEPDLFLQVQCGTGRTFVLPVTEFAPKTAKEANNAGYSRPLDAPIYETRT